jgi:pimeloyl-ACP methyl ester carboxylesterase
LDEFGLLFINAVSIGIEVVSVLASPSLAPPQLVITIAIPAANKILFITSFYWLISDLNNYFATGWKHSSARSCKMNYMDIKKPLILLHGAIGSSVQLQPLRESLHDVFDVHVLDFPGHGGKALPEHFSIPYFAAVVEAYVKEHMLGPIHVFGYSMGGYVAAYLALHFPDVVDKIATLATKFHWTEEIAAKEIKMLQPDVIRQKLPAFAKILEQRHQPQDWRTVLQMTATMLSVLGKENAMHIEDYAQIQTPALIMLGDRDKMVSVEETMAVYQGLPKAQLSILPQTAHPIEATDMELLSFMLIRFFVEAKE